MIIGGLQGTGKTYLAVFIAKQFRTMVYTPHKDDWEGEKVVVIDTKDYIKDFPFWCHKVIELAKQKKVNLFVVDEADMLFKSYFDTSPEFRDLIINHRHYGLAIILITRRIQDIPAKFYGMCEYMACFIIEDPLVLEKLNAFSSGFGDMVKTLGYESYEFIMRKIGEKPQKYKV